MKLRLKRLCLNTLIVLSPVLACAQDSTNTRLLAKSNDYWGYVDRDGDVAIPFKYTKANPFDENGIAQVDYRGEFQVIDKTGEVLLAGDYEVFKHFVGQYYKYKQNGKWGVTTLKDKFRSENVYLEPYPFSEQPYLFKLNTDSLWGVLDSTLKPVVPFEFSDLWLDSNHIITEKQGKWGAYSLSGKQMLKNEWDSIQPLSTNHLIGFKGESCFLVNGLDHSQRPISQQEYYPLNETYFGQDDNGFTNVIRFSDLQQVQIKSNYVSPLPGYDHNFVYALDGFFGLYHFNEKEILKAEDEYQEITATEGLLHVRKGGKFKLYSVSGKLLCDTAFDQRQPFMNNLAFVRRGPNWGIISRTGELPLPITYRSITILDAEIRAITSDGSLHLYEFRNGQVTDKMVFGSIYKLNLKGFKNISQAINMPISNVNTSWFLKERWGLRDSAGKILIKPLFSAMEKCATSPYVLVQLPLSKYDKYPFGIKSRGGNRKVGLVDESTGKIIAFPHFSMVDRRDVNNPDQDFVRVRSYAGYYAVVSKSAKRSRIAWKSPYIGPFKDGLAPIYLKGYMTLKKPSKDAVPVGTLASVLQDMGLAVTDRVFYRTGYAPHQKVYMTKGYWNYIRPDGRLLFGPNESIEGQRVILDFATPFERGLAKVRWNGKWALINVHGEYISDFKFHWIETVKHKDSLYYRTYVDAPQHTCFNNDGKVINSLPLTQVDPFSDGYAWVKRGKKTGLMDMNGKVTFADYEIRKYTPYNAGYASVKVGRKWHFVNEDLEIQEDNRRFYNLGQFNDARVFAKSRGPRYTKPLYGFLNEDFEWVIQPKYLRAYDFKNGFAMVKNPKGRYLFIDRQGQLVSRKQFSRVKPFNEAGIAQVWKGSRSGVINAKGDFVVPLRNHRIFIQETSIFVENHWILVVKDLKGRRLSRHKKIMRVYPMKDGLARVRQNGYIGYINNEGKWALPPKYSSATDFENGFALVGKIGGKVIINSDGDTTNPTRFKRRYGFSNGFIVQQTKSKPPQYYFVNTSGVNRFGTYYQYAQDFQKGKAIVMTDRKYGVIDTRGLQIVPPIFSSITQIEENYVIATNRFNYGLLGERGEEVLPPVYENIRILPDDVIMITKEEIPSYMDMSFKWIWKAGSLANLNNF